MQIDLTPEEARIVRAVFFPANPNKLRANPIERREQLQALAWRMIRELEKEGGR